MARQGFRIPEQLLLPWSPRATISAQRAARMLDCHTRTIRRLIASGSIEAYQLQPGKAGSPYRVNYDSVLRHLKRMHDEAGLETKFDL